MPPRRTRIDTIRTSVQQPYADFNTISSYERSSRWISIFPYPRLAEKSRWDFPSMNAVQQQQQQQLQ